MAEGSPTASLVEDVVICILEHVYCRSNRDTSFQREELAKCSLISKIWRRPAQNYLFNSIEWNDNINKKLTEFTKNPHYEQLAHRVRILDLCIGRHGLPLVKVATAMTYFPYLYELRLHGEQPEEPSRACIAAFSRTPPIHSLRLLASSKDLFIIPMLQIPWPLRHLHISRYNVKMTDEELLANAVKDLPSPPYELEEFRFEKFHEKYTDFLKWLLGNSIQSMQRLHMVAGFQFEEPSTQMKLPNLRSLSGRFAFHTKPYMFNPARLTEVTICCHSLTMVLRYIEIMPQFVKRLCFLLEGNPQGFGTTVGDWDLAYVMEILLLTYPINATLTQLKSLSFWATDTHWHLPIERDYEHFYKRFADLGVILQISYQPIMVSVHTVSSP